MFIVLELQATADNVTHIFTTYSDQAQAESNYHLVLSAAAVSTVPMHSALLMTADGQVIRSETYKHESE